nr:cytochrome P450 [Budvicia aquatica]
MTKRHGQHALHQLVRDSYTGKITLDDKVFRKMAMSVLIENFFSVCLDSTDINIDNIAQLMEYSSELSFVPAGKLNISYRRKLVQLRALRRQVTEELKLFRHPSVINPMIERILKAESEPDSQVVLEDELMTFLAAGSESTAAAIGWACYLLAQYPEQQERLYQEAVANPDPMTWEALSNMPQLMTFISEALRLYPPIPMIIRQSLAKDNIGIDLIEERQNIVISFIGIMHDASVYPNPWSLNIPPDRYSPFNDKNSGINMAFSQGPRLCGGKDFALVELAGFISTFVRYGLFSPTSQLPPRFYWKSQMVQQGGHPVQVTLR